VILDTSAIMAILKDEPEATCFGAALADAETVAVSAATLVEAGMVAEGRGGPSAGEQLDRLVLQLRAEIVPFTAAQAAIARDAWRRYGKGRHPAKLNLGDCFAYALAKARGETLLFKGADFALTDVRPAV
jgi:ribonuclease VapC